MKLKDFLNSLAQKAGKENEQGIIDILSRSDLENIDITDNVAQPIISGLLTIDGAKNNPVIKSHFNALALGSMDSEILNSIKKLELGDEFEVEISGLKNTYEKQRKVTEKIAETITALKASAGKGDDKSVEKYTKQINDLNQKLSALQESTVPKTELEKVKQEQENAVRDFMIHSLISGLSFANKDVKPEINIQLAKTILDSELKNRKATIVKDGNDLKLKRAEDAALDFYDETNKPVSFKDFMDKAFADAKILAVSGGKTPNNPPVVPPVNNQYPGYNGNTQAGVAEFQSAVQRAINDLK
ncbi:MAG: hypothetical protein LBR64_10735 [Dysgonamonadaceae bacterium]|jgi:hypothetical protein|nr:hypothetical protein [Dysgonamonadaceae bacterium]